MSMPEPIAPLAGWQVVVLRPRAGRDALDAAVRAAGGEVVAIPCLRIAGPLDQAAAARALAGALEAAIVVFTSPAAVSWARRLPSWTPPAAGRALAVGPGTAGALERAGARAVQLPARRSDSEGVLSLPALQDVQGTPVGLVTAPGGRGLIASTLSARGALLCRADVYRRLPPRFDARHRRRLQSLAAPVALLLSSAEALRHFVDGLQPEATALLQRARVVAASERLAQAARDAGAGDCLVAASAAPADLVAALTAAAARHAKPGGIR